MSDFMRLNWLDLGKGVLVAFLTVFLGSLYTGLSTGAFPSGGELATWTASGLAAGIAYLIKNLLTNSDNQLAKTEPK